MTSAIESPRRRLAELSPMTQRTASMMLDLPQPLGPTTPVMLVGRCSTVGSTKDLKPESLIVERRMRDWGRCKSRGPAGGPGRGGILWDRSGAGLAVAQAVDSLGERQGPAP